MPWRTRTRGSRKQRGLRFRTKPKPQAIKGMKRDKGLVDTYRKMNPTLVSTANKLRKGDLVKYKKSSRVVERAWGKVAGVIEEIRCGRSGPLLISAGSMKHIGPKHSVALIRGKDGTVHFSDTRDLIKVEQTKASPYGYCYCGKPLTRKGQQFCSRACYDEARKFESRRRI